MPITGADLQTEFPKDFGSDSVPALQRSVDRAYRQIGDAWGSLADDGALYLAAHLRYLAVHGAAGGSGAVQSKKVGEVSITYATAAASVDEGSLGLTWYGREYLRLISLLGGARFFVDESDNYYDDPVSDAFSDGGFDGNGEDGGGDLGEV